MSKNVLVFGGTGGVGLETIYQSLNQVRGSAASLLTQASYNHTGFDGKTVSLVSTN